MSVVKQAPVTFILLYRTSQNWRTTVGTTGELACGALEETSAAGSFQDAAGEFTNLLREYWDVRQAIDWQEISADSWGADLVPGALAAAGELPKVT